MPKIFTKEENQAWSKTLPGKMCSACITLRSSNQVLMVKANYKDHWTFPSGIVDENESPMSAALRETIEEVGVAVEEDRCTLLTVVYSESSSGGRDRFNFAFLTDLEDQNIKLSVPNDEIEKAEWVDIKDVANRSGNKGSYLIIQEALLDGGKNTKYAEVHTNK
jgi:8-oxo-dGTP pyrophosphatase MutT (NUDIX family)